MEKTGLNLMAITVHHRHHARTATKMGPITGPQLLQRHRTAYDALVLAMGDRQPIEQCCQIIREQLLSENFQDTQEIRPL